LTLPEKDFKELRQCGTSLKQFFGWFNQCIQRNEPVLTKKVETQTAKKAKKEKTFLKLDHLILNQISRHKGRTQPTT